MKKATKNAGRSKASNTATAPSRQIDARINELDDWRGETLARIRAVIKKAVPDVIEEWKWRGVQCGIATA